MFSFFSTKKSIPKQIIEVVGWKPQSGEVVVLPKIIVPKKTVRINEAKNDTILFQDLNSFLGYHCNDRHPHTGIRSTRISRSGKISSIHVLPNGTLMEMRYGNTYPPQRRIFTSYSHWMNFLMTH